MSCAVVYILVCVLICLSVCVCVDVSLLFLVFCWISFLFNGACTMISEEIVNLIKVLFSGNVDTKVTHL